LIDVTFLKSSNKIGDEKANVYFYPLDEQKNNLVLNATKQPNQS
jgi:hypothetical protein